MSRGAALNTEEDGKVRLFTLLPRFCFYSPGMGFAGDNWASVSVGFTLYLQLFTERSRCIRNCK